MSPRACSLALAAALAAAAPALAKEGDVVNFAVGTTVTYDDNLLRLPDGVSPRAVGVATDSRSAFVNTLYGQVRADVPVSRQRFVADFTVGYNRYSGAYDYLDYTGTSGSAKWLYQFGNAWKGELGYNRRTELSGFADQRLFTRRNVRTTDAVGLLGDYWLVRNWRLSGGVNYTRSRNSDSAFASQDLDQTWVEGGVKYESSQANFVRLVGRYTYGSYPERPAPTLVSDTSFDQYELAADGNWVLSPATRLYGRAAYTRREFPNLSGRDFSGPTGRVSLDWTPTVKTGITFLGRREIGAVEDITATYVVTSAASVSPYWLVTQKVRLDANLEYQRREYAGDPVFVGIPQIDDRIRYAGIGLRWAPTYNWLLSAGYRYSSRTSNFATRQFNDNTAYGTVQLNF